MAFLYKNISSKGRIKREIGQIINNKSLAILGRLLYDVCNKLLVKDVKNNIKDIMQEKDTRQELEALNYLSKGDQFVFYVFRKVSKISYATYVITDLIKDTEPLKWTLRKSATEMASLRNFLDEKSVFNNLEKILLELEAFLDLASFAKVVSEMNSELLRREIKRLIGEMRERAKEGYFAPQLGNGFFDVPKPEPVSIASIFSNTTNEDLYKGHKRHDVRYDFYKTQHTAPIKKEATQNTLVQESQNKGQRRGQILDIIKEKGGQAVSIKDITDRITDCSEKTIQRELIAMVLDGTLKKTGERRWSTYSIN